MTEQKRTWNFDVTRLSNRDLNACLFFLEHARLPEEHEVSDAIEDLETYGTGREVHLIELAALFAVGLLLPPDPVHASLGVLWDASGTLPSTVDPGWYDGANHSDTGGINLYETYVDFRLAELAPILVKYPFYA